jgi:hypothetical protein
MEFSSKFGRMEEKKYFSLSAVSMQFFVSVCVLNFEIFTFSVRISIYISKIVD